MDSQNPFGEQPPQPLRPLQSGAETHGGPFLPASQTPRSQTPSGEQVAHPGSVSHSAADLQGGGFTPAAHFPPDSQKPLALQVPSQPGMPLHWGAEVQEGPGLP